MKRKLLFLCTLFTFVYNCAHIAQMPSNDENEAPLKAFIKELDKNIDDLKKNIKKAKTESEKINLEIVKNECAILILGQSALCLRYYKQDKETLKKILNGKLQPEMINSFIEDCEHCEEYQKEFSRLLKKLDLEMLKRKIYV